VAFLLAWALAHHLLAGVRHLLTDISVGSTLSRARRSAWAVNLGGVAMALWVGALWL
jgi:succinate dehydrogenase / fumarate reductase cytochrome b subunit